MEGKSNEGRFQCSQCPKTYSRSDTLRAHERDIHGTVYDKKQVKCEICSKHLGSRRELKRHMAVHDQDQAYSCSYCSKEFSRPDNLKVHEESHNSGEIQCEDELCKMVFKTPLAYKRHKSSHTDEIYVPQDGSSECQRCTGCFIFDFKHHHQIVIIDNKEVHQCTHCLKLFKKCIQLPEHVFDVHTYPSYPTGRNGRRFSRYNGKDEIYHAYYCHAHRKIGVRCERCHRLFNDKPGCNRHQATTACCLKTEKPKKHGHYVLGDSGWKWTPLDPSVDLTSLPTTEEKIFAYHQARVNTRRPLVSPTVVSSSVTSKCVVSSSVFSSSVASTSGVSTSDGSSSAVINEH